MFVCSRRCLEKARRGVYHVQLKEMGRWANVRMYNTLGEAKKSIVENFPNLTANGLARIVMGDGTIIEPFAYENELHGKTLWDHLRENDGNFGTKDSKRNIEGPF
jgi:hypothetical protein